MPRRPRVCPGGTCFHVLNRAVAHKGKGARLPLFEKLEDYEAFERVLIETHPQFPLPLLCNCLMCNHWHFVVRPANDNPLSDFFRWSTHTHVMRWHAHYHTEGTGHLYHGRFKAFPIEEDDPLDAVLRSVERNPVRAELCERAEDGKFGSARRMANGEGRCTIAVHPERVADSPSDALAGRCQPGPVRVGSRRDSSECQARNPLGNRFMDHTIRSATASRAYATLKGATKTI